MRCCLLFVTLSAWILPAYAWDYEGHRALNELALAALPPDFPAFVQAPEARERIGFLGGEPDRWRNTPDLALRHFNNPDHYIDLEDLEPYQIAVADLPRFRYEFVALTAARRAANPGAFPRIDPKTDAEQTKALVGFLPWAITENYAKLKSAFSYLKAFEENGTREEIANAQQNVIYLMGLLGHYVGDAAQPLHTTRHYNGWVGSNPRGFTTNRTFHSSVDGGYFNKGGGLRRDDIAAKMRSGTDRTPRPSNGSTRDIFPDVLAFITNQFALVERTYELEKAGAFTGWPTRGRDGKDFLTGQMAKAGSWLSELWVKAWKEAPADNYLKAALTKRKLGQARANEP